MKTGILTLAFWMSAIGISFGQWSSQKISTDSSDIEVIRNSVYHIYEETYKNKDSVWYSVHYIKDTTRLNTEGWQRKSGEQMGIWKEFDLHRNWMYTWDHDKGTCELNPALYPYNGLLASMKTRADSLIISAYSKEFFDKHVRFDFNCSAYDGYVYLGSWTEPITRRPNSFLFRYDVRVEGPPWYDEMIGIELDSLGNYLPSEDWFNNYGFEQVATGDRTFHIDKNKALETAMQHGAKAVDPDSVTQYLTWERDHKAEFYDGRFRYYITEPVGEVADIRKKGRSNVVYKFNVYSFDPWTGEFVEKKRMKNIHSWEELSGSWTGLIPDE